jgi:hypothetical protein
MSSLRSPMRFPRLSDIGASSATVSPSRKAGASMFRRALARIGAVPGLGENRSYGEANLKDGSNPDRRERG